MKLLRTLIFLAVLSSTVLAEQPNSTGTTSSTTSSSNFLNNASDNSSTNGNLSGSINSGANSRSETTGTQPRILLGDFNNSTTNGGSLPAISTDIASNLNSHGFSALNANIGNNNSANNGTNSGNSNNSTAPTETASPNTSPTSIIINASSTPTASVSPSNGDSSMNSTTSQPSNSAVPDTNNVESANNSTNDRNIRFDRNTDGQSLNSANGVLPPNQAGLVTNSSPDEGAAGTSGGHLAASPHGNNNNGNNNNNNILPSQNTGSTTTVHTSSSSTGPSSSNEHQGPAGSQAGSIAGGAVGVVAVVGACLFVFKYKKRKNPNDNFNKDKSDHSSTKDQNNHNNVKENDIENPYLDNHQDLHGISYDNVDDINPSFGTTITTPMPILTRNSTFDTDLNTSFGLQKHQSILTISTVASLSSFASEYNEPTVPFTRPESSSIKAVVGDFSSSTPKAIEIQSSFDNQKQIETYQIQDDEVFDFEEDHFEDVMMKAYLEKVRQ